MGYLVKTTFWLGLVYAAMPLGGTPELSPPLPDSALCEVAGAAVAVKLGVDLSAYHDVTSTGCAALDASKDAAPTAKPSADTLTAADRRLRWMAHRAAKPS